MSYYAHTRYRSPRILSILGNILGPGVFELKLRFSRLACWVICALLHAESLQASQGSPSRDEVLIPSVTSAEHQLSAGETHTLRAELEAGVWRLSLTQYGIDTVARLELPNGTRLGPFNSPEGRRGLEAFLFTLESPGSVRVSIHHRSKSATGRYTALLESLTPADAGERSPLQQESVLAETAATAAARSFAEGSRDDALEHYRRASSLWPASDPAGKARTLVALANLTRRNDEPGEAAELFRRALTIWQDLGDQDNAATTMNRLGLTLDTLGDSLAARQVLEQALELRQRMNDPHGEFPVRFNLCLMLQRQGDFVDARDCYQTVLNLVRELREAAWETAVLSSLAGVYWKLGEPDRALKIYDEVLTDSDEATHGRTLSNRALLYAELGETEQALLDFGQALPIFRRLKLRRLEGATLNHLGRTYLELGELDRARTYLEQALPLRQAAGDSRGAANTWRGLGQTYGRQGEWDKAFGAYAEALTLSRQVADRRGEATLLGFLGRAHAEVGSLPRALLELERAVELQRELGDRRQMAQALLELGKAQHQANEPERALELLGQALDIFRSLRDRAEEVRTLEATARVERGRGRPEEALAATKAAVELLEDLRTRAGGLRQRASFLAARRGVYELQIDLLMQRHSTEPDAGHDHRAFEVSERARSRALLDLIQADTRLDEELQQRLRAATRRLSARTERQMALLGRDHDPEEATLADREVVAALTDLEAVRAEARRQNSSYEQLLRDDTVNTREVASLLDSQTVLLEFVLGEPRSFLWTISPNAFTSHVLPGRKGIENLARQAHADLNTLDLRTGRTSRRALEKLSEQLLLPGAQLLETAQRLVVVADGALNYLPFAALPHPLSDEPLVASHEIVHLPSASTLAWQRRQRGSKAATKTLAILADPVFDARDSRLFGTADAAERTDSPPEDTSPADLMARVRGDLGPLGRLTATGEEAAAIASLVGEPNQRLLALGFEAHRERVLSGELASYRYVHFATHGLINARQPDLSGLALATYDVDGETRNGFLSMDDVYGLEWSAEMVVLSGCQTALGREIRGEGLLGLSRGFMAAGVPRLVASLWPVQDEVTARLMTHFYRGVLVDKKPPAAALIAAQRAIREQRRWADPYFWSAFVLLGDWR